VSGGFSIGRQVALIEGKYDFDALSMPKFLAIWMIRKVLRQSG
jgi:hypothetical protein